MRATDDRYHRERVRLDLALRFIEHEARTQTIRRWTGLTDDRIRKLYRSYLIESGAGAGAVTRHRGKSPQQSAYFLRTVRLRRESALLASLCTLAGVLADCPLADAARRLPGVRRGDLLCSAYDLFRELIGETQISFEHAVLLVTRLAAAEELSLRRCSGCGAVIVSDRFALRDPRCTHCLGGALLATTPTPSASGLKRAPNC